MTKCDHANAKLGIWCLCGHVDLKRLTELHQREREERVRHRVYRTCEGVADSATCCETLTNRSRYATSAQ